MSIRENQFIVSDIEKTEFGWNVRAQRPATRHEMIHQSRWVCMCSNCALSDKCQYSAFYCARTKETGYIMMIERYYWNNGNQTVHV